MNWNPANALKRLITLPARNAAQAKADQGEALLAAGKPAEARGAALEGLRIFRDSSPCHLLLARVAMPGMGYIGFLQEIHRQMAPKSYFEVGVFTGQSLKLVAPSTLAVGVDPEPHVSWELSSNMTVHAMTSDAFFEQKDLTDKLKDRGIDLVFLDGLHTFEQTLRDFINTERLCRPGTLLFLHDCLPPTRLSAQLDRQSNFWCGDVWKMVPCLRKYRPDLLVQTIAAHPSGLTAVANLDPDSEVLSHSFAKIMEEFAGVEIDYTAIAPETSALTAAWPSDGATAAKLISLAASSGAHS